MMRFKPDYSHVRTTLGAALIVVAVMVAMYTGKVSVSASRNLLPEPLKVQPVNSLTSVVQPQVATPFAPVNHFIVIYQENWSFDALYGNFPGANGYLNVPQGSPAGSVSASAKLAANPQIDVFSSPYGAQFSNANRLVPQPINNGAPDGNFTAFNGQPLPYELADFISPSALTGDIVHRFHTEQSQIDGGKMDKFVSLSDNPGLVMSGFDATNMPEGLLAQQYVMCDNFFHAAFGGSFLNHQWLIAAQTPPFPTAPSGIVQPAGTNSVNGKQGFNSNGDPFNVNKLSLGQSNVNGNPVDSSVTTDGFAVNTLYTINTPHPASQNGSPNLVPNQNNTTIGDKLTAANVNWKWYSGGWNNALAGTPDPLFQFHHQPFAYYTNYADVATGGTAASAAAKAAHLQDETQFLADLANNTVPNVVFIKPIGDNNEHPGYTSLSKGQQHVASLVNAIQNSPTWKDCVIVITYDEHGGHFDHVAPPSASRATPPSRAGTFDRFGPGVRVPTIIISPFARRGVVDHTEYDTTSILATIEHRYGLTPLGTRDGAVNDFTNAFNFNQPVIASVTAAPLPATIKQAINFNVSATSPTAAALTYTWNFGEQIAPGTATGPSVTHSYSQPGTYTAVVTVSDGTNTVTGSVSVLVNESPILVDPATANPSSTIVNTNVGLSALATSPAGLTLTYTWNFGDATATAMGASVKHMYAAAGIYTATVTISDGVYPAITSSTKVTVNATNTPPAGLSNIQHVIVIYQENWSFDALYGNFPGANGYANAGAALAASPQIDVFSTPYGLPFGPADRPVPQPINNGAPDGNFAAFSGQSTPYDLTKFISPTAITGDIVHRFYTEQAQIDGGKMDKFISLSDNPGLVMSYFDATNMPEGLLAKQYVLCDNFFHAAFGGSFLNHQWLISAQSPVFPTAPASIVQAPSGHLVNGNDGFDANNNPAPGIAKLSLGQSNVGGGTNDHAVTTDGFAVNTLFTVNTPHPSVAAAQLVPNQTNITIGDRLNDANVSWTWYSGGWDAALAGNADPLFQFHHQPFAYYQNYADGTSAKATHLKDETKFFADLTNLSLPSVVFIKPIGTNNEHPGYAALAAGQQHVASIVQAVQASQYWQSTLIVITYDEHGGHYDHVAPPSAATNAPAGTYDRFGPGVRVPTIIISPFAKKSFIDHTAYDTTSILKFIETRWSLPALGTRDAAVNSLDNALNFVQPPMVSAPTATPSSAGVGQTVTFSATATSPTSSPLTVQWNFGDPTSTSNTASTLTATHVYAAAGVYTATLTVSDAMNPPVIQTVSVTVSAPVFGAGKDSDGDGFSDSFENLYGTNPNDFTSTPNGGKPAPAPVPGMFNGVRVRLVFDPTAPSTDFFTFSGTLPVPAGTSIAGQKIGIDFGGVFRVLPLYNYGSGKTAKGTTESITFMKPRNGVSHFKATFKNENVASILALQGLTNATVSNVPVTIKINVLFNGGIYSLPVSLKYSATKGAGGFTK